MTEHKLSYKVISGPAIFALLILSGILALFTRNGIYIGLCITTIVGIMGVLWKSNRPGIFVFAFLFQWLQVVTYVFWVNSSGKEMAGFSRSGPAALVAGCVGLFIMALVIHFTINNIPIPSLARLKEEAKRINRKKLLIVYVIATLFLTSIRFFFGSAGGADQVLVTISSLKWVFFMMYGFVVLLTKKNRLIFAVIIVYEFVSSLTSYFSNFKEVLLFTIIVSLTFINRIRPKQLFYGLMVSFVLITLLLTWAAIKSDYRRFVNKGRREQIVAVERSEALTKMQNQVTDLSWKNYKLAMDLTLYRVQYLHNLSLSMDRVPYLIPYQNGAVWEKNISFVISPRIIFPDKGIYNASEKARMYTGLKYAGIKEGSSFSLGYFADSYVDFGYIGMYFPLALLALFVGLIYRAFYNMKSINLLFRFAVINIALYNFISFEADGLFLFGRLLTNFIVYTFLCLTLFPRLQRWMYKKA